MLHLLLDEHVSPTVAQRLRARTPPVAILSMQEWHGGACLGKNDDVLLEAAHAERLTLVTYDQQSIKPLLRIWGAEGTDHSGIVFVASNAIAARDIGSLVRALAKLWDNYRDDDWLNRVTYLVRA
jgi:hypothetical protein